MIWCLQSLKNYNPQPYNAEYYGHKLHIDQNEKLAMCGVTHVVAVDGFGSRIVKHATMPVKNNLVIYQHILRLVVSSKSYIMSDIVVCFYL